MIIKPGLTEAGVQAIMLIILKLIANIRLYYYNIKYITL